MVLGGDPPGRVGRRRDFSWRPRRASDRSRRGRCRARIHGAVGTLLAALQTIGSTRTWQTNDAAAAGRGGRRPSGGTPRAPVRAIAPPRDAAVAPRPPGAGRAPPRAARADAAAPVATEPTATTAAGAPAAASVRIPSTGGTRTPASAATPAPAATRLPRAVDRRSGRSASAPTATRRRADRAARRRRAPRPGGAGSAGLLTCSR